MERLPDEVLLIVISVLCEQELPLQAWETPADLPPLSPYACIFRRWQHLVESATFATIKISSDDLGDFARIYAHPRRQAVLRRLEFAVHLPNYSKRRRAARETQRERRLNNQAFTQGVGELFRFLSGWKRNADPEIDVPETAFELYAHAPMDDRFSYGRWSGQLSTEECVIGGDRCCDNYLTFLKNSPPLPVVHWITQFALPKYEARWIHPKSAARILASLPRLGSVDLHFVEPLLKRRSQRLAHRLALTECINIIMPYDLWWLQIVYDCRGDPSDHSFDVGDMRGSAVHDKLSIALRKLYTREGNVIPDISLQSFLSLSSDFFWPLHSSPSEEGICVSSLRYLKLFLCPIAADGSWYYTGNPADESKKGTIPEGPWTDQSEDDSSDEYPHQDLSGYISDDPLLAYSSVDPSGMRDRVRCGWVPDHPWRSEVDPEMFFPWLRALSRSTLNMPHLVRLSVKFQMASGPRRDIVIEYIDAGSLSWYMSHNHDRSDWRRRRCGVYSEQELKPWSIPEDVEANMREWIGTDGLLEVYIPDPGMS